jgi:predicted ArsR family transcriptional regulator
MPTRRLPDAVDDIAVLADPVRRALYRHVCNRPDAVSRDDAARAVGVSRALAAFHLDKLVAAGLLITEYRRLTRRRGPGAGRPSKLYRRALRDISVSLPPRDYELAAHVLAQAAGAGDTARARKRAAGAVEKAARQHGIAMGQEAGRQSSSGRRGRAAVEGALRNAGYEPIRVPAGDIRLRNCPFDALAGDHRELVCGMNLALLRGMLDGLGATTLQAALDPQPGMCCVVLRSSARPDAKPSKGVRR